MEQLSKTLMSGGIKDLLLFFPANKRDSKVLEEHFRTIGLPQVADWFIKKQNAAFKEAIISELREHTEQGDTPEEVSLSCGKCSVVLILF